MKGFLVQQASQIKDPLQKKNLIREYLQARVLQVLQEQGAFMNWAFLGGTALRFLYGIPRYSEDLDFSVIDPVRPCIFEETLRRIKKRFEGESYSLEVTVNRGKIVRAAFLKFPDLLFEMGISTHKGELLSVKIEVDTNPPSGANTENTICRRFVTLNLTHYDKASLLAGKLHAILARPFAKGRDYFDLIWYLADSTWPSPNFKLLNAALEQTGWKGPELASETLRDVLSNRVNELDWNALQADVMPFIERPEELKLLNRESVLSLIAHW